MVDIHEFTIPIHSLQHIGQGLSRPENVLAFRDGTVYTSSNRGYVARIHPDGSQSTIGSIPVGEPTSMALDADGNLLVNNTSDGKLYRFSLHGHTEVVLDTINGQPIGSTNYVFRDSKARTWLAVSSRRTPPFAEYLVQPDGYIVLIDDKGPRIVADGLYFPNEIKLDQTESYAYVPETFGRRVLRFRVQNDGSLVEREVFGPTTLGVAALPDGLSLDADGNVWVLIVSHNSLVVIARDGQVHSVFADPNPPALSTLASAYAAGAIPRHVLADCAGSTLKLPTSIAFGGPDLQTAYIGSLGMPYLLSFRSPIPGLPLQHQRT